MEAENNQSGILDPSNTGDTSVSDQKAATSNRISRFPPQLLRAVIGYFRHRSQTETSPSVSSPELPSSPTTQVNSFTGENYNEELHEAGKEFNPLTAGFRDIPTIIENITREDLLRQLKDVNIKGKTGVNAIYALFHEPSNISIEQVVKAMLEDISEESIILDYMIREALLVKPELFGTLADPLRAYFKNWERTRPYIAEGSASTTKPMALERVPLDIFEHAFGEQLEGHETNPYYQRLQRGDPIVYNLGEIAIGDTLLAVPGMRALAEMSERLNSKNPIYVFVSGQTIELVRALMKDYPQVEIRPAISNEKGNQANQRLQLLELLSSKGKDSGIYIHKMSLSVGLSEEMCANNGILYGYLDNIPTATIYDSFPHQADRISIPILNELGLTNRFQVNFLDADFAIEGMRTLFTTHIDDYLSMHSDLSEEIDTLLQEPGFENGYITMVLMGNGEKFISHDMFQRIAESLKGKHIGIVLLDGTHQEHQLEGYEVPGVTTHKIKLRKSDGSLRPFEHSAAWMRKARGTVGIDTSLTHLAELLPGPVVDIHSNSDPITWRFDERIITAQHPFARWLAIDGVKMYVLYSDLMGLIGGWRDFYLSSLNNLEQRHPLVQIIQQSFSDSIHAAMGEFMTRLQNQ